MKNDIAIIILAHHNPEQLSLLINHLKTSFTVYVQIDKKSKINISELPKDINVNYYKDIEVYWGDFSLVKNMHDVLLKAYLNKHSHYLFISGDDLPIKSNQNIINFLNKNKNSIYMYANPLPIATWGFNQGFDRLDRYWYMKIKSRNLVKALNRILLYTQRILLIKRKRFPVNYFAGSQWINLTNESVQIIFEFLEKNPQYLKKLKHSRATDEIWVQTIIMNSSLKSQVVNTDLRYIDWETGPEFPRVLNELDEEKLLSASALFARKFNYSKNKAFIKSLLKNLK
ncbi:beta-1,6-N-acetylglucosaminyltransferase [Mariniflexile litorale]|uniref:Peptide O-xylosyltransferase n=1 Tax=Mariniflexile litorale TaxID=3045158 RepID=A0AAU7ECU2_9FLAO|nr:beta-1,6-N-acetylglucosaminyltransferase [Mariniflexile sp. KMM 9835]MDQ8211514.1 beta-1,6-N-acetylglucosaminyltransferase [Mariniflexile sp. KMM 9835]